MQLSDIIQTVILIVLALTFWAIYRQFLLQNRLYKAQLMKDRFDTYWRVSREVSDNTVRSFKDYPEDWISIRLYEEKYRDNERKIRRYIYMSEVYEYLAFNYGTSQLGIPDPLGDQWSELWVKELVDTDEFNDVHKSYAGSYPEFETYIDSYIEGNVPTIDRSNVSGS